MNNDQHNGALKFSIAGLFACGAVGAYFISPAVHQAVTASLSYVLLAIAFSGYAWIGFQAKKQEAGRKNLLFTLLGDAAVACVATAAAINIAAAPEFRQFDIMNHDVWNLTGDSLFSHLQLDTLIGMLAVAAWIRAAIPGRLYGSDVSDFFSPIRWIAIGLAVVPAVIHLNVNYDSLPKMFWLSALIFSGSAWALTHYLNIRILGGYKKNKAFDDQHLRGSQLISAKSLADQIRSRLKMK